MSSGRVLVVEDDRPLQDALVSTLRGAGYEVGAAGDGSEALERLAIESFDLVVTDVQMQPVDGCELLRRVRDAHPSLPVLMMTAHGTIEQAVGAMRDGAVDYLVKPFEASELERQVGRYVVSRQPKPDGAGPIAADPRTQAVLRLAQKVAVTNVTVLLNGESGTGKEVFARFIHRQSARSAGPFVAVNCAAIPEHMLEAMLFGHEKGAFTGAQTKAAGKFAQADGGTLLLDEVTEMPVNLQAKLLRALQEREIEPLGATVPLRIDVRVIATTNRRLEQAVADGEFREDLFYRLSVFPIAIPPLRERPGDVDPLIDHFVAQHAGAAVPVAADARDALRAHAWPGNVRELNNVVQRALVLAQGEEQLTRAHFSLADAGVASAASGAPLEAGGQGGLAGEMRDAEARRLVAALETFGGNRKRAAEHLNVSARTLRYKLAKLREAGWAVPAATRI